MHPHHSYSFRSGQKNVREGGGSKRKARKDQKLILDIPETEVFALFQNQRWAVMDWLRTHEVRV
jgi:hypothetical protein